MIVSLQLPSIRDESTQTIRTHSSDIVDLEPERQPRAQGFGILVCVDQLADRHNSFVISKRREVGR
jgi:hypothetical protein